MSLRNVVYPRILDLKLGQHATLTVQHELSTA